MDAQSNTDRIPCKESQDITRDSMSDSFLCDWIQLRSTEPGFWSLSSSEASFRANTQTNKALLDESVVSFANIHSCNVCTLHRNLLAIRTSLTLIQIHDYLIHTIPLIWTDRLWCCPGQLSKSHEAEKYRIEGQQEYDNFDNWSNCHHHVQVVYPTSPELASEKKDARNHVQDKHGCKKHIARRKYPSRGRRREWQGIGRALARFLKWAWWLGGLKPLTNSAYKARTMNPISYLDLFGSLTLRKINPASGAAVRMSRSKYIKCIHCLDSESSSPWNGQGELPIHSFTVTQGDERIVGEPVDLPIKIAIDLPKSSGRGSSIQVIKFQLDMFQPTKCR